MPHPWLSAKGGGRTREADALRGSRPDPISPPPLLRKDGAPTAPICFERMDEAVRHAVSISRRGDVVVLSPGYQSYDAFCNFQQRGDAFISIVRSLHESAAS